MMKGLFCFSLCSLAVILLSDANTSVKAQHRMPSEARAHEIEAKGPHAMFDLLAFRASNSDSTRMDLYVAVPYSSLEFTYAIDKYVADYAVGVVVINKERELLDRYEPYNVLETTTDHQVRLQRGVAQADAEQISFMMSPGENYELRLSVRDLSSRREFDTVVPFQVKNFSGAAPEMSDLLLYRERKGMRIVPCIGPDVSSITDDARIADDAGLFAEIYNLPSDSTLGVVTEIIQNRSEDNSGQPLIAFRAASLLRTSHSGGSGFTAPASVPETLLFVPLEFGELWVGRYIICTFILPSVKDTNLTDPSELQKEALTYANRSIRVRIASGIPISEADLDQAIDQLHIIASSAEWDSLSNAKSIKDKRQAMIEFWNRKNSSSGQISMFHSTNNKGPASRPMDVFYARVDYANSHFGNSYNGSSTMLGSSRSQQGWKTDRGRVYIALGPPDYIDSHPEETIQKPYEIWEYSSLNARYTFVDEYMLGEYYLRGAAPPQGTFIWDK
jgi:GWxTD domain-containing protein